MVRYVIYLNSINNKTPRAEQKLVVYMTLSSGETEYFWLNTQPHIFPFTIIEVYNNSILYFVYYFDVQYIYLCIHLHISNLLLENHFNKTPIIGCAFK